MLPKGGCKITDQILVNMDYNEYLCHGNFRMLIWLLKFLVHWSPKDLMLTLNETSPSILESAFFVVFFFQIWHCIKWEVNMWCHNDQRRFWIEKNIKKQFISLAILKFTGWKENETDTIHFLLLRLPRSLVRCLFMMFSSKGGYFIVSLYVPPPIIL